MIKLSFVALAVFAISSKQSASLRIVKRTRQESSLKNDIAMEFAELYDDVVSPINANDEFETEREDDGQGEFEVHINSDEVRSPNLDDDTAEHEDSEFEMTANSVDEEDKDYDPCLSAPNLFICIEDDDAKEDWPTTT